MRDAVLAGADVEARSAALQFFIDVARHAMALNCFAVVDALLDALW